MNPSTSQLLEQVPPLRIAAFDQRDLPIALPLLHARLALNGVGDKVVFLDIHKLRHAVPFRELRRQTFLMLPRAAFDVVGDAAIQRPIFLARENVEVALPRHAPMMARAGAESNARADARAMGGRVEPGHDGGGDSRGGASAA